MRDGSVGEHRFDPTQPRLQLSHLASDASLPQRASKSVGLAATTSGGSRRVHDSSINPAPMLRSVIRQVSTRDVTRPMSFASMAWVAASSHNPWPANQSLARSRNARTRFRSRIALEASAQHVAEQVVEAVPAPLVVERRQEEARPPCSRRAGAGRRRAAGRPRPPRRVARRSGPGSRVWVRNRRSSGRWRDSTSFEEIRVHELPLASRRGVGLVCEDSKDGALTRVSRRSPTAQPSDRSTASATILEVEWRAADLPDERDRLGAIEAQVVGTNLRELAPSAQQRHWKRRLLAARDHELDGRRQAAHEQRHQHVNRRLLDQVKVVEHDDQLVLDLREIVGKECVSWLSGGLSSLCGQGERLASCIRYDGAERRDEQACEADEVAVDLVKADPHPGPARFMEPTGQRDRLPESGRRAHQRKACGPVLPSAAREHEAVERNLAGVSAGATLR